MSPTKRWVLYLHENRVNGKKYIGITSQRPERRWDNGRGYIKNDHFYKAIQKYGWHAFRHEILYTGLTQEEAERTEITLIAEYGTLDPEKGYNNDPGGRTSTPTPETRKKMSEAGKGRPSPRKGTKLSPETKAKLRAASLGNVPTNKGQKASPEARAKMSAACKGRKYSLEARQVMSKAHKESPNVKRAAVVCVETGECFASMADAALAKKTWHQTISRCCAGKQKTAGGYHWEYYNDTPIFDTKNSQRKEE